MHAHYIGLLGCKRRYEGLTVNAVNMVVVVRVVIWIAYNNYCVGPFSKGFNRLAVE